MIAKSLIEILREKEYNLITVTELCDRSQIARRTFYRNFKVMDDVLTFIIKDMIEQFKIEIKKHTCDSVYEKYAAFFTFWNTQTDMLSLLIRRNLSSMVFIEYIKCLEETPAFLQINAPTHIDKSEYPFILTFTIGGLWSVLNYYILNSCSKTPQELAKILTEQFG